MTTIRSRAEIRERLVAAVGEQPISDAVLEAAIDICQAGLEAHGWDLADVDDFAQRLAKSEAAGRLRPPVAAPRTGPRA